MTTGAIPGDLPVERPDARPQTPYDVLVIGGTGVDTIVRVDELAIPAGDYSGVPPIRDYVAHTGNGVALGFHALGRSTKFIDYLGDDPQGRMILDRYAAAGLDFSHLPAPAGTPRSVNLVDRAGRRFSFYDGRHPHDLRLPREFYLPHLSRARHVHISRSAHAQDVFADAIRLGRTVSTDLHAWDGQDASAHPWAYGADLVFLCAAAAGERIPEVMRQILAQGRATLVVATDGAAGCRVLERGEQEPQRFPAVVPERPVVDSNGAGDAFLTGFLHARFGGADRAACVLAGSVSGAYACGSPGTHEEMIDTPTLAAAVTRARWNADADRGAAPLPTA
ncbi:Sugar or nucleoside kinase, ribokinase family [Streptomyces sp. DvalAA-14]|uniref:carbohydrate kinase family protein n=1 Tax=unclassified Streptomyces TaxID=2593676 RepID=UPI00081B16DD|nr:MULTISPECIES: carbohydrate kinase family protein [unclassified Streptomyces]MYS19663.1 carbohydrate kinase family protein [Streptomyces sp. SID4948]SCD49986.1 Sugar or nucleoside kinase, ribokinase family [Streptomyces sp. DvalAA-14]